MTQVRHLCLFSVEISLILIWICSYVLLHAGGERTLAELKLGETWGDVGGCGIMICQTEEFGKEVKLGVNLGLSEV